MNIHRRWLVLSLLVGAAFTVPALAQQPAPPESSTPAAAAPAAPEKPAKPKKMSRHKSAASKPAAVAPGRAAGGAKPALLGQYGEWGAYSASPGGKKVCFAVAKPMSSETDPPHRSRDPSYMFISTRPADKVSNEVSVIIGYPFKPNSDATLAVGSTSFDLYTQQDGAWIKNLTEEAHMVEAMRAGQSAVVKGISSRGTRSIDTYSLRGLAQALDRAERECQ